MTVRVTPSVSQTIGATDVRPVLPVKSGTAVTRISHRIQVARLPVVVMRGMPVAVGERLDAVERIVGIRHRLRAAADGQGGSGGIVAVGYLAHGMTALIEGCRTHQGATRVEVGAVCHRA